MAGTAAGGFTSARGRSHTFDIRADGYARGEAVDTIVCRGGDGSAVAVGMLGSAVRQDGRSASLTAPNGQAQQGVLHASLADAHLAEEDTGVLEAHGTGTALGDPIEAGAAASVFLSCNHMNRPLMISSLKANAGHTEPGAGMAGALKLLMQLRDAGMSLNAQLRALNPHVRASLRGHSTCVLPTRIVMLRVNESELAGGVSSFGYAGTIAHLAVQHIGSI